MFDEVLCHLITLSIHGVLSVLDFYVPPLHLNTLGGPSIQRCCNWWERTKQML